MANLVLLSDFQKSQVELWLPVVGCCGYEVSNMGRIRSYHQTSTYQLALISHPIKVHDNGKGYLSVSVGKTQGLHVLVAKAFIPNPLGLPEVNHKNGIKHDCRAGNLEWATPSQNQQHAVDYGLAPSRCGEANGWAILTNDMVLLIRGLQMQGISGFKTAKFMGLKRGVVYSVRQGRAWQHVP